jgi:hypothetical protein
MAEPADDLVDRLYGLPLDEFTGARNAAAADLRARGEREAADAVKALRKPNAAAWALNRVVHFSPAELDAFLDAAGALREAQFGGGGDLRSATAAEREALRRVQAAARSELGRAASAETLARVRQSLEAAAVDDAAAARLRGGRLVRELEPGGFGSLVVVQPAKAPRRASPPAKPKPDPAALARARRALERAHGRLARATAERDRRRDALAAAEEALSEAAAEAERAAAALAAVERGGRGA